MIKNANMEINHENAMSLWKKRYGKATRVKDFAGREMDKGSYGNRNSEYGWNLDHILPQSQGGKDSEFNLICCHIKTNNEKADKYPVFNANGKAFEIVKVENHYEINEKNPQKENEEEDKGINFFDYSAGIAFFNKCKKNKYWIGTIHIILADLNEVAVLDFIREVLSGYKIKIQKNEVTYAYSREEYEIIVRIFDVNTKEFVQNILDDCVLLNTYLKNYFLSHDYIGSYSIINNLYGHNYRIDESDFNEPQIVDDRRGNRLIINELVRINTSAEKENLSKCFSYDNSQDWIYDYTYTRLSENLGKVKK